MLLKTDNCILNALCVAIQLQTPELLWRSLFWNILQKLNRDFCLFQTSEIKTTNLL